MYYLQSRYYSPEWGRFINADAEGGKIGDLLSHNVFAYCMNNPVNLEDPSGNWPKLGKIFKSVVNAIVKHAVAVTVMVIAVVAITYAIKNPRIIARAGTVGGGTAASTEKASEKAESSVSNVEKVKSVLQNSKKVTQDGSIRETFLNENTKVVFKAHVDELAHPIRSEGYTEAVNHYNIEIQTRIGDSARFKARENYHFIVDDAGKFVKIFPKE